VKPLSIVLRSAVVFLATCIFTSLSGILIPVKGSPAPHLLEWMLLTTALTTAALTVLAVRSEWRGWKLGTTLALIPLVISSVNLLEGVVFLTNVDLQWGRIFLFTVVSSVLTIPLWALLFGRKQNGAEHFHPIESLSRAERAWRFALSDFTYLFLYYGTGMIIFPYVKDFYATQHLPSIGSLVALQLLVRGPVFVLLCIGMTRMLGLSRISGALAVGAIFTLISGVAPLLMPNPAFPDSIRWVHFCEVTTENFVFGAIVAWLWGQSKLAHSPALAHAA
jgi:hypothetical protein